MPLTTVETENRVTLFGAGEVNPQNVDESLMRAPWVVAADGGAAAALSFGLMPEAVIGDLDSLPHSAARQIPADKLIEIAEQESTDFEKCLSRIGAPLILAVGFTGRRADHELAVYNTLVRYPEKRCIVIGAEDMVFAAPRHVTLDLSRGTRVSLFPMTQVSGSSDGLRWPIDAIDFAPDGRIGTSNEATGPVRLSFDVTGMLVILPLHALDTAINALLPGG